MWYKMSVEDEREHYTKLDLLFLFGKKEKMVLCESEERKKFWLTFYVWTKRAYDLKNDEDSKLILPVLKSSVDKKKIV